MKLITQKDDHFYLRFPFNRAMNREAQKLPGAQKFNKKWMVPARYENEVESFAQRHGFQFTEPVFSNGQGKTYPEVPLPELDREIPLNMKPYSYQKNGIAYILREKKVIVGDQMGLGKAQPLDAKIATPRGWVRMGDILCGTEVFGPDGNIYHVRGFFPQGRRDVYRVTFNDGTFTECDLNHIWTVRELNRRRRGKGWINRTTKELLEMGVLYNYTSQSGSPASKWEIPLTQPIKGNKKDFLIHPYILGVLIGDGNLSNGVVCFSAPESKNEIVKKVKELLPVKFKLWKNRYCDCPQYYITQKKRDEYTNRVKDEITRLRLNVKSKKKFIPEEYLFSSIEQRVDLLRGLMDTDGSAKKNRITFHTCSEKLAYNVRELVSSLGGQAIIRKYYREKEGKSNEYQVNVKLDICPFYLNSKKSEWWVRKRNRPIKYIRKIEKTGKRKEQQCISVSHPDGLYLTDNFIVTHNTMQAIAAITAAKAFPCLVICPATLKINWEREWEIWTNYKALTLNDSIKNTYQLFFKAGLAQIFIVNYESLQKYFVDKMPDRANGEEMKLENIRFSKSKDFFKSVIIDESHRVKEPSTIQTKLTRGIADGKEYRLLLTGTPVVNAPKDLAPQLAIAGRINEFGGYRKFIEKYGDPDLADLNELSHRLKSTCFFRRDKSEATDLPPKTRQKVYCDITTRDEYNVALEDLAHYLKEYRNATDEQVRKSMKGEVMVRIGALKNISARGKLPAVFEFIEDTLANDEKLVLFGHLHEVLDQVKEKFKCVSVTGKDNNHQRQYAIDSFQNDTQTNLIACSIAAAGVGITLTAASTVAFIEMGWHPAIMEQAEDRLHRIGQTTNVQAIYFIGRNTIDEWVYQLIDEKRQMSNTITGAKDDVEEIIIDEIINLFNQKL